MAKIDHVIDAIERLVFGATAQERVDMLTTLINQRVEARIIAALDGDADERQTAHDENLSGDHAAHR